MVAASEEDEAAELVPRLASPHSFSQPREKGAAARGHSLNASAASEEDADAAVMVHRAETAHAALQSSGAKEAEGAVPEAARWQDSPAAAEVRAVLEEARLETLLDTLHYNLGIECLADLRFLEESLLADLHLPPVHTRKLLQLAEGQRAAAARESAPAGARAEEPEAPAMSEQAQLAQRLLLEREQRKREEEGREQAAEIERMCEAFAH